MVSVFEYRLGGLLGLITGFCSLLFLDEIRKFRGFSFHNKYSYWTLLFHVVSICTLFWGCATAAMSGEFKNFWYMELSYSMRDWGLLIMTGILLFILLFIPEFMTRQIITSSELLQIGVSFVFFGTHQHPLLSLLGGFFLIIGKLWLESQYSDNHLSTLI